MTTESNERQAFNAYKKAIIEELGSKALDDRTVNRAGKHMFAAWSGVFPVDRVKLKPYHYCIINTRQKRRTLDRMLLHKKTRLCVGFILSPYR